MFINLATIDLDFLSDCSHFYNKNTKKRRETACQIQKNKRCMEKSMDRIYTKKIKDRHKAVCLL